MLLLLTAALVAQVSVEGDGGCVEADAARARLETVLAESESLRVVVRSVAGTGGVHAVSLRVIELGQGSKYAT